MGALLFDSIVTQNLCDLSMTLPVRMKDLCFDTERFGPLLEIDRGIPLGWEKDPIRDAPEFLEKRSENGL